MNTVLLTQLKILKMSDIKPNFSGSMSNNVGDNLNQ